jgi:hypothetical protein
LLTGIYGCERICGDLQPVVEPPLTGGAGAGGDGGVTAGEGGAPPLPAGSGPGGVPSEGGGGAGGQSGATSGDTCAPPADAQIIDFDEDPPSLALGEMTSDAGSPDGQVVSETSNVYREIGNLPDQADNGFTFTFNACIDVSDYAGIQFDAQGNAAAGVDASILPASTSEPGNSHHFDPKGSSVVVCVPFAADQKTVEELRFTYAPLGTEPPDVSLSVDNFVFTPDPCSGT